MITVITRWKLLPDVHVNEVHNKWTLLCGKGEAGFRDAQLFLSFTSDVEHFVVISRWNTRNHWEIWNKNRRKDMSDIEKIFFEYQPPEFLDLWHVEER